jgi:hypothetical protein
MANNWNHIIAARKIEQDMKWRSKFLPIHNLLSVIELFRSGRAVLLSFDKTLSPCLFLKLDLLEYNLQEM